MNHIPSSGLSREVKKFLEQLNEKGALAENQSVEEARRTLNEMQATAAVDLSGIVETQKTISFDHLEISLNIVRPEGITGSLPVFLFVYGGGWVAGNYATHKRMVRDLVVLTGFAAVIVHYTPSPEAKYPRALHEIHTAAKWILEHEEDIQVIAGKMGIVGNDVGATMAASISLMAKANGGPDFKVQILMWPALNAEGNTDSWTKFQRQQTLTAARMKFNWDQYTTDEVQRKEIYASPLLATSQQLRGLPPTLIQLSSNDILQDEGEAFGQALDEAGVPVTVVVYKGVIHDFAFFNALSHLSQTQSCLLQAAAELKRYLG